MVSCALLAFVQTSSMQAQTAQSPRDALLVSSAWLAQHLNDPDLVLLHVGDPAEYAANHIAGARFVSLREISVSDPDQKGLHLELPQNDSLRLDLAGLGISDRS